MSNLLCRGNSQNATAVFRSSGECGTQRKTRMITDAETFDIFTVLRFVSLHIEFVKPCPGLCADKESFNPASIASAKSWNKGFESSVFIKAYIEASKIVIDVLSLHELVKKQPLSRSQMWEDSSSFIVLTWWREIGGLSFLKIMDLNSVGVSPT